MLGDFAGTVDQGLGGVVELADAVRVVVLLEHVSEIEVSVFQGSHDGIVGLEAFLEAGKVEAAGWVEHGVLDGLEVGLLHGEQLGPCVGAEAAKEQGHARRYECESFHSQWIVS